MSSKLGAIHVDRLSGIMARLAIARDELQRVIEPSSVGTRQERLMDSLETAIFTKAFVGELVDQDPSDEPAADLLARIQEVIRASKTKRKKKKKKQS